MRLMLFISFTTRPIPAGRFYKMHEPLWRKILCWGAVVCFFLFPGMAFALVIHDALTHGIILSATDISNLKSFGTYQATLTALLFGLAGLNTWDRRNGGK